MEKNDGGPAFPVIGAPGAPEDYPGMSLRDWFAGHALQAFMSWSLEQPPVDGHDSAVRAARRYSEAAYKIADAMLKAREK